MNGQEQGAATVKTSPIFGAPLPQQPALQLIYDTAPIGLAFLSPDCRYLQINQRLTEICGISVEDHLGRSVRDCVPALADAVQGIVDSIMNTGDPVIGVEVAGQRADQTDNDYGSPTGIRYAIRPVRSSGSTSRQRKRAEAALRASERQFHTLADSMGTVSHDWQAVLAPGPFHKARDRRPCKPARHSSWSYRCAERMDSIVHS